MSIGLPVRASMAHAGSPHPSPKVPGCGDGAREGRCDWEIRAEDWGEVFSFFGGATGMMAVKT